MSNRITASLGSKGCAKPKHALCDCQQPREKNFHSMRGAVADDRTRGTDAAASTLRSMSSHRNAIDTRVFREAGKNRPRVASTRVDACRFRKRVRATRDGSAARRRRMNRSCGGRRDARFAPNFPASHKPDCAEMRGNFFALHASSRRDAHADACVRRCGRRVTTSSPPPTRRQIRSRRSPPDDASAAAEKIPTPETKPAAQGGRFGTYRSEARTQSSSSSSSAAYSSGVSSSSSWPTSSGSIVKIQPSPNASSLIVSGLSASDSFTATTLPAIGL